VQPGPFVGKAQQGPVPWWFGSAFLIRVEQDDHARWPRRVRLWQLDVDFSVSSIRASISMACMVRRAFPLG
jgi:hypothetical protein